MSKIVTDDSDDSPVKFVNPTKVIYEQAYHTWLDNVGKSFRLEHVGFLCFIQRRAYKSKAGSSKSDRPSEWTLRTLSEALELSINTVRRYRDACVEAGFLKVGKRHEAARPDVFAVVADPAIPIDWGRVFSALDATCIECVSNSDTQDLIRTDADSDTQPRKNGYTPPTNRKTTSKTLSTTGGDFDVESGEPGESEDSEWVRIADDLTTHATGGTTNPRLPALLESSGIPPQLITQTIFRAFNDTTPGWATPNGDFPGWGQTLTAAMEKRQLKKVVGHLLTASSRHDNQPTTPTGQQRPTPALYEPDPGPDDPIPHTQGFKAARAAIAAVTEELPATQENQQ